MTKPRLFPLIFFLLFSVVPLSYSQYCMPYVYFTDDEDIENVTFAGINNTSVGLCNGYTDYTSISGSVVPGGSYAFSVNTSDCEGINFYDRSLGIWIDFNQDQDFDDVGEMVYSGPYLTGAANVLFSGTISIPPGALGGSTRMRVTCVEDDIFWYGPCDDIWYGEIEDYTINVLTTPCISPPTAGTATISDGTPCPSASFSISVSGGTMGIGQTYQWQSSPDNVVWSNIPGATSGAFSGSVTDTTWFRLITTCSGLNDTTNVVVAETDAFLNCYCVPTTTYGCGIDYIDNVTFESINNTTGCTGTYNDFTAMFTANVIQGNSYPLSVTTDGDEEGVGVWIDYDHSGTFDASEFVLNGFAGTMPATYNTNVTIPGAAIPGLTRMRVRCKYNGDVFSNEACSNFTYGEIEDYFVNIIAPPPNDGGLLSLISPATPPPSGCTVGDTIIAVFNTIGTNGLTSLNFVYSVNGGTPVSVAWTGSLVQYAQDTFQVAVTTLVDGDVLEIWVEDPNGATDGYTANDTLTLTLHDALSGVYTIGGASPDYATINDAKDALETYGLCGPVIMNIRDGAYTEQVSFGPIPGASAVNTVTFQSESMDAGMVTIDYTPSATNDNFVFQFKNAGHIIINELTLMNVSYYSRVVEFKDESHDIRLANSVLIGDTLSSSTTFDRDKVVVWSGSDKDNNIHIVGNDIRGGEWGVSMWGTDASNTESGLVIDSNNITGFYQAGIVLVYQSGAVTNWNHIAADTLNPITNLFMLDIEQSFNGATVVGNNIYTRQGGFGINLFELEAQPNNPTLVANNFVYMGNQSATTYCEGIAIQDASNINVVNNTVHNRSLTGTSGAVRMFMGNSSGIQLVNNNLVHSGMGYAVNSDNGNYLSAAHHNNLYTDTTNFVRMGTSYANLAALQSATSFGAQSISVDPLFNGEDLHTCVLDLDNVAVVWPGVTHDNDGDTRNTNTPDIGGDEFTTTQNFTLGPDTIKCPNDSIELGAEVILSNTYYWSPYFQTTPTISALTPGTYVVQIASSCGATVDSIVVSNYPLPVASFTTSSSFYTIITDNTSTGATSYLWNFGDGNTSTIFEPNHVYAANGTYTITLTAYSDCGDSVVVTQTVVVNPQFFGVDTEELGDVSLYPNPSDGYFNLSLISHTGEDIMISVMDLSGRTIYSQVYGSSEGEFNTPVDIRGAAAGTYVLRLQSGKYSGYFKVVVN